MPIDSVPPVLLITFNRPDNTKRVFEAIRNAKPRKLYVASDGPRKGKIAEVDKVHEIRKFLIEKVDWNCNLQTLFQDINQGCKYGPQSAITWFFEKEDHGIILEDDCLPSPSFFKYTSELLSKYENDLRIFGISGVNFFSDKFNFNHSYYFSRFFMTWGWATWKSRWKKHLSILENLEQYFDDPSLQLMLANTTANRILIECAKRGYYDELDAWDYQWILTCMINHGLIATPSKNLIQNIGFGEDATHTFNGNNRDRPREKLKFPLKHPRIIYPNRKMDNIFYRQIQGWLSRSEKLVDYKYLAKAVISKIK